MSDTAKIQVEEVTARDLRDGDEIWESGGWSTVEDFKLAHFGVDHYDEPVFRLHGHYGQRMRVGMSPGTRLIRKAQARCVRCGEHLEDPSRYYCFPCRAEEGLGGTSNDSILRRREERAHLSEGKGTTILPTNIKGDLKVGGA